MKRFPKLLLLAVLGMAATISSCENNDANAPVVTAPSSPTYSTGRVILSGEITTSRTLRANEKYLLQGNVCMTSGNTLTAPAGTKIFGDLTTKGTLVIECGAKILAEGKQTNPIVFTSAQAASSRKYGDWGRVVLVGAAPINRPLGTLPEGGIRSLFGGTNAADNSGTMKYVRIEFAGVALSSGTTLDYIQVSYAGDDSYEWFGGTVNAQHLIAYRGWDDDFDTDFGFAGKIQYGLSLRNPQFADQSGSNGFESDNFNPGTPATGDNAGLPLMAPVFSNMSVFVTAGAPLTTP